MKRKQVSKSTGGVVRANKPNTNRVRSSEFVTFYTNDVSIFMTSWDMCLRLGVIQDTTEGACVTVQQFADLRMSPQFAKKLTQVLISQLCQYEELLGLIPQPRDSE